jgi:tetratricopeptide (TPR) repeat protein
MDESSTPGSREDLLSAARAYEHSGEVGQADSLLSIARRRFPCDAKIAWNWARISTVGDDRGEAIVRLEAVKEELKGDAPWRLYTILAQLYKQLGRGALADDTLDEARDHYPSVLPLAIEWARMPTILGERERSVERFELLLGEDDFAKHPKLLVELARAQEGIGRIKDARDSISLARHHHPEEHVIAVEAVAILTKSRALPEALATLDDLAGQGVIGAHGPMDLVPLRRLQRIDWELLGRSLVASLAKLKQVETLALLIANWQELTGDSQGALTTLQGLERGAVSPELVRRIAVLQGNRIAHLTQALTSVPSSCYDTATETRSASESIRNALTEMSMAVMAQGQELVHSGDFRISLMTVVQDSIQESAANLHRIDEVLLHQLCTHLGGSPTTADQRLSDQSREAVKFADSFAKRFSTSLGIPVDALRLGVTALALREFDVIEPIARAAHFLAQHFPGTPIYMRADSLNLRYLKPADESAHLIYLIMELSRLGVALVLYDTTVPESLASGGEVSLVVEPGLSTLSEPTLSPLPGSGNGARRSSRVLIPAHLRQASAIALELKDCWVLETAHLTSPLSHSAQSRLSLETTPKADFSIHAPRSHLPTFRFRMQAVPPDPSGTESMSGPGMSYVLHQTAPISGDYQALLRLAVGRTLRLMWKRALQACRVLHLTDVHACDAITVDSAFMEAAVRSLGGRVHLWPHSANPNLPSLRSLGTIDSVVAATRTGCEEWMQHHPNASVRLHPESSLPRRTTPVTTRRGAPLSVVVLGTSTHRYRRPILPVRAYEDLVVRCFDAFAELAASGKFVFLYKPKIVGLDGDWLKGLVPNQFWSVSNDHVLTMRVHNPVFVSIGFGSTALIEGAIRRAPGLSIPLNATNDYMALRSPVFGEYSASAAVDQLKHLSSLANYRARVRQQDSHLADELGDSYLQNHTQSRIMRLGARFR